MSNILCQVHLLMISKRSVLKCALRNYCRMSALYPSEEKSMEEIRSHLVKFPGGSVNLDKKDDGLALIILNQAEKKNAMTGKMMVDLHDVVEELGLWTSGKGVILKGSSGNFCSGGDLDFVRRVATPEEGFMMSVYMHSVLNKFQRLPLISVALVEGIGALGGGSELSVACDFVLMSEACRGIGFVHGKMGILPAWGGANRLVQKVGYANALEALSTARIFSPLECLDIGLVDEIIPGNENCEEYAISWLRRRTRFDEDLMRSIKTMVSSARDFPGNYEMERRLFAPFWGSAGHKEALRKNIKHIPQA